MAHKIWVRMNGGNWNGSPTDNPATGVGGIDISAIAGLPIAPTVHGSGGHGVSSWNFGQSAFTYSVPSGFTAGWPDSGVGFTAFDPAKNSGAVGLSGSNRIFTNNALGAGYSQSADAYSVGKFYFEATYTSASGLSDVFGGGVARVFPGLTYFGFASRAYYTDALAPLGGVGIRSEHPLAPDYQTQLNALGVTVLTGNASVPSGFVWKPGSVVSFAVDMGAAPGIATPSCGGTHTTTSFTAAWTPSGAAADTYTVQWRQVGTVSFTTVAGIVATSLLITGLQPGTAYEFKVNALNTFGNSGYSALFPCSTDATPAGVTELWFGPVDSFVDMSLEANRRKFVTSVGATQNLYPDGSAPFDIRPPVFLTRYTGAAPNTFAANAGKGGTFAITGGDLTEADSAPPCAFEGTGAPWVSDAPIVWLRWSDDRGRTWSNPIPQSIGATGAYLTQVQWNRTGMARDRIFEVFGTVPGRMAVNGAWLDPEPVKLRS